MNTPKFNSKDEFEAYLSNSGTRLNKEANVRRSRNFAIAIPIAILAVVALCVVPGMVSEWALKSTFGDGISEKWSAEFKENQEKMKEAQKDNFRQYQKRADAMREQHEQQMRNFTKVQSQAIRQQFGR